MRTQSKTQRFAKVSSDNHSKNALALILEKAREIALARSYEEKAEAARRAILHRDPIELRKTLKKAREASLARSHEEKSQASSIAMQRRDRQELELTLKKAREVSQARSHEEKSEAAKKAAQRRHDSSSFKSV